MTTVLRYPEETLASADDFRKCGWKSVLEGIERETHSGMWQAFSTAAGKAIEAGNLSEGKVLWLLADACSMMIKPSSHNEPFQPIMIMGDRPTPLPDDFKADDVALLAEIVEEVDDQTLRARLSDIVWLLKRPRDPKFAQLAINAYQTIPIDSEAWLHDGREYWERAISLSILLGSGGLELLVQLRDRLFVAFQNTATNDGLLGLWISELLEKARIEKENSLLIANKLEELAKSFKSSCAYRSSRDYFEAAAKWYRRTDQNEKPIEMEIGIAETWVEEANERSSAAQPSHMVIARFLESAIHAYRRIPKLERAKHNIEQIISSLHSKMNESGKKSLEEMGTISSDTIDISQEVEASRNAVRGKPLIDALAAFAAINPSIKASETRKLAEQILKDHVVLALFSSTYVSRDGRVIARRPGAKLGDANAKENEEVIWAEMVKNYGIDVGITVQSRIWPALETLLREHRFREADFVGMAKQSPLVPNGREQLFGKALFLGFEKDFVSAIHLVIPQIENMIRWYLKRSGAKTTTIDSNGIENENGLSTLVETPELQNIFGEDFVFELKALFCDAYGANLRNELSHGLLEYEQCQSVYAIYAWWFSFRIVFNTFWNETRSNLKEEPGNNGEQPPAPETQENSGGTSRNES